ncbi:hypothetical protein Tco_0003995 [Tanacetum coccineum]
MVWSGYAVLMMSGKTDSIKLNNIPGCLPGSTFVYSEVSKLDFSSASTHLKSSLFSICYSCLDMMLVSEMSSRAMDKDRRIMGQAVAGPAGLWRCWPRQSSAWCFSRMPQLSSLRMSHRMFGMSSH